MARLRCFLSAQISLVLSLRMRALVSGSRCGDQAALPRSLPVNCADLIASPPPWFTLHVCPGSNTQHCSSRPQHPHVQTHTP